MNRFKRVALNAVLLFVLIALLAIVPSLGVSELSVFWPHHIDAVTGMALATSVTGPSAFTIAEFCKRNSISRGMFYKLLAAGQGPRLMQIGTHKRISTEAEADWKRAREADAGKQAA